ncbi:hypothetical protein PR048_021984 [Dryococelus australis]|uniref:Uncharacterized protein n=1 Tax=Dryococelus australis TaxID=614101 RepID=A0ABQ9GZQ8_9NEOP|nr:hypothetical protein PR048_021984 [Dryococelus australis]
MLCTSPSARLPWAIAQPVCAPQLPATALPYSQHATTLPTAITASLSSKCAMMVVQRHRKERARGQTECYRRPLRVLPVPPVLTLARTCRNARTGLATLGSTPRNANRSATGPAAAMPLTLRQRARVIQNRIKASINGRLGVFIFQLFAEEKFTIHFTLLDVHGYSNLDDQNYVGKLASMKKKYRILCLEFVSIPIRDQMRQGSNTAADKRKDKVQPLASLCSTERSLARRRQYDRSCKLTEALPKHLCPVAPSWLETRPEIGSKIDTENCCTIRVHNWTGDQDEVHFEPLKLAVRSLDPRLAAIVIDESKIQIHKISLVQHFYIGTRIKLDPGSELGSFYLGSGKMLVQPGIRSVLCSCGGNHGPACLDFFCAFESEERKMCKGYTARRYKCAIASTHRALNWRAVFLVLLRRGKRGEGGGAKARSARQVPGRRPTPPPPTRAHTQGYWLPVTGARPPSAAGALTAPRMRPRTRVSSNAARATPNRTAAISATGLSGQPARLPPRRSGFNPQPGHSGFLHVGTRAGRCRLSAGFLGDLPFPTLSFRHYFILTSLILIGSQYLDVKIRPKLFTHSRLFRRYRLYRAHPTQCALSNICREVQGHFSKVLANLRSAPRENKHDGGAVARREREIERERSASREVSRQRGRPWRIARAVTPTSTASWKVAGLLPNVAVLLTPLQLQLRHTVPSDNAARSNDAQWPVLGDPCQQTAAVAEGHLLTREVERFGRLLTSRSSEPMRVIEVSMEQRRNDGAGETGHPEKTRRPTVSSGTIPTCENPEKYVTILLGSSAVVMCLYCEINYSVQLSICPTTPPARGQHSLARAGRRYWGRRPDYKSRLRKPIALFFFPPFITFFLRRGVAESHPRAGEATACRTALDRDVTEACLLARCNFYSR